MSDINTLSRQNISSGGAFESVFGYSRAVKVGDEIHVSGSCAPIEYEKASVYEQTKAILKTIGKALNEAQADYSDVVQTIVYLRDINDASEVAKAHQEYFGNVKPASTLIQITSAMRPWQQVEISAIAVQNKQRSNISSGGAFEEIFGYSRAVAIGNKIHVSGSCATVEYEKSNTYEQSINIFKTMETALNKADATMTDVVRTIVYLRDINDAEEVAKAHREVFGNVKPASTLIQVVSMMRPWQKVEISAYAVRDQKRDKITSGGAFEDIFGYSRAIKLSNETHVSGSCASAEYEKSSAFEQSKAILKTIKTALEKAESSFDDVIRTVVYVRDMNDAEEVAKAHCEVFGEIKPASTLVQVTSMMRPWQKVEIEAYALTK